MRGGVLGLLSLRKLSIGSGSLNFDHERIEVLKRLTEGFLIVVLKAKKIEQMVLVFIKAGPQNVDLGLADGGRALVLDVVDVAYLLSNVILDLVLVRERGRDVVLNLEGIRLARHPEVSLHPDGHSVHLHIVTLRSILRVA